MPVRWSVIFLLVLAVLAPACRKSDAERAARERAAYLKEVEKASGALVPYRLVKTVLRSATAPDRPKELDAIAVQLEKLSALSQKQEGTLRDAEEIARTAVILYQARKLLDTCDEDSYPLLWTVCSREPLPEPWYDNGAEHLGLAAFWEFVNAAPFGGGKPMDSPKVHAFAHYELARAVPGPAWPPETASMAFLVRGLTYCGKGYHFASDEELTRYLEGIQRIRPEQLTSLEPAAREQGHALLLSAGYFLRAWNRLQMGREEPATEDLEAGLKLLEKGAGENELTLWASAFVDYRRGRYGDAGLKLEKLAASPYLEPGVREELLSDAKRLQEGKRMPGLFKKGRAGFLIARALVMRAGGPEKLLARLVGEEGARRVFAPVASMMRLQHDVALYGDPKALAGKATGAGSSFWGWIKDKLGFGPE